MASEQSFLRMVLPALPTELSATIREICIAKPAAESTMENLIRLISGAECAPDSSPALRNAWTEKQTSVTSILNSSNLYPQLKRRREGETDLEPESQNTKRPRLSPSASSPHTSTIEEEGPVFTLHSVSVTSPIRKKVDITITKSSIKFVNPSNQNIEASIAITAYRRAFLLPTRGKSKPHWTVVLISSDIPGRGKTATAAAQDNPQIIFGVDALTTATSTTTSYTSDSKATASVLPKGSDILPSIRAFLSHLTIPLFEPTVQVFKSACAGIGVNVNGATGIPGIEAYRAAKAGTLWFMREGILWGESKPCEFWSVEDLLGKSEGVRILSAGGRTCTVILTRKSEGENEVGEDEDDIGEETEFGMVDAKEKEGINQWVRQHRHLFGKKKAAEVETGKKNGAPLTIHHVEEDSDAEDEDFEASSSDDGSVSSDEGSSDGEEGEGDEEEEEEEGGEDGSGDEDDEGANGNDNDEELDEKHHPLLRPGAMPRMSRAAIDMVVGLVEQDLGGGASEPDEEDELED